MSNDITYMCFMRTAKFCSWILLITRCSVRIKIRSNIKKGLNAEYVNEFAESHESEKNEPK